MARRHKKRAWNMSNPLYRYLHSKRSHKRRSTTRGGNVARHRRRGGFRSGGGLFNVKKLAIGAGIAILGAGILGSVLPSVDPKLKAAAVGYMVAGPAGALGAFAGPMILGGQTSTQSNTAVQVYS